MQPGNPDTYQVALQEAGQSFLSLPEQYNSLKQKATERLKRRETTKNKDLAERFEDRFKGKEVSGFKVDVQLRGEHNSNSTKPRTLKFKDGTTQQIQEVARVWFTEKSDKPNEGTAFCYKMDSEGNWYVQKATSYTYDKEKNTNDWKLGAAKRIDDPNEIQFLVDARLQNLPVVSGQAA